MKQGGSISPQARVSRKHFTVSHRVGRGERGPRAHFVAAGFTIVETMIVLAVTGLLVASALLYVNGKQNRTEFQVGVNELQQQIQQIINGTESGYFPTQSNGQQNFKCTSHYDGTAPTITGTASAQGSNGDCIFLGKVLYFGPGNSGGGSDAFTVFPIAGNRLYGNQPVATLQQARPVPVAPGTSTNRSAPNDATTYPLESGMTFVWGDAYNPTNPGYYPNEFALGFLSAVGTAVTDSSGVTTYQSASNGNSGTSQFGFYGFRIWPGAVSSMGDIVDDIAQSQVGSQTQPYPLNRVVSFCIASGTTNQSALFRINPGLHVSFTFIDGNTICQ
ncbi:MAG TPA: prepilin-type N-terminal cleavage/methylation domain-containing protein [Candidatus Saccharimonadales bacterium]